MKKIIALLSLALMLCGLSQTAFADTVLTDYEFLHGVTWHGESTDQKKLLITDTVVFSENVTLKNKSITIEKDAVLEITNGAELVLDDTEIYVENGGNIIVSDGKIEIDDGLIVNIGLFIIGKNGAVNVKQGTFRTKPEGGVVNNGLFSCYDGQSLKKEFSAIKKYDSRFNIVDYSFWLSIDKEGRGLFYLNYCIGRIETNYMYKVKMEKGKRSSITRSPLPLSEVYSTETRNKLLDRVFAYETVNDPPEELEDGCNRERYYLYEYKSGKLIAEAVWLYIEHDFSDEGDAILVGTISTEIE